MEPKNFLGFGSWKKERDSKEKLREEVTQKTKGDNFVKLEFKTDNDEAKRVVLNDAKFADDYIYCKSESGEGVKLRYTQALKGEVVVEEKKEDGPEEGNKEDGPEDGKKKGVKEQKDDPDQIDSEDEFKDYVKEILRDAHGDGYDEEQAEKMADDLLAKSREKGWSWGDLVGVVQNSLGS